jgi:hypothetical protein
MGPPARESDAGETTSTAASSKGPALIYGAPGLGLAYRRFSIANLDPTPASLRGLELDLYPVATRWLRAGVEVEAGKGQVSMTGNDVDLHYGMVGAMAGLQVPTRVSPFVQGRLVAGVLAGSYQWTAGVPETQLAVNSGSAATYIHGGGVDVGADLHAVGRLCLSASVGWMRTTWRGPDTAATAADPQAGLQLRDLTGDSFTLKLGIGI